MGKPLPDDDDLPDLPDTLDPEDEVPGTADVAELELADIPDGPEDVGLDADLATDAAEHTIDADDEDDGTAWLSDEAPLDVEPELDIDGEEHGWTEDSEGSREEWSDDFGLDDDSESLDDGGLEGVEDPWLDELEERPLEPLEGDDEAEEEEEYGDDLLLPLPLGEG